MNADIQELRKRALEPIAVIGMACRMPGGANTPALFGEQLSRGVDAVGKVPPDRWDADAFYSPDPDAPGKTYVREGGFIEDPDLFDAQFFGITPVEAIAMDPQQRLLLEVSWEALESAGQSAQELNGSRTSVFVGMCGNDYSQRMMAAGCDKLSGYMASGGAHSVAAGRLSYFFGFQGPCMSVDTACSSSLAAVHMAFQSLRRRECSLAIAGGVNLILAPELNIVFSKMRMLSPDGRCKVFDASADGYGRSDGCGMVVLKRQSDALRDGDRIRALIRGGAVNQDGRSGGLTVPNGRAQQALIREALSNSGVEPGQVSYLEAHGTGTSLGDPIEVHAIAQVFADSHKGRDPLMLGSVKANIGHTEGAAGVASFIKTVLALEHKEIFPNIHAKHPNPHIAWADLPVHVPTTRIAWAPQTGARIAGVSAFGFSGTNVHLVVEEAPEREIKPAVPERPRHVLPLSAKTETALREQARRLSAWMEMSAETIGNICHTAGAGRSHFAHRAAIVAGSRDELKTKLQEFGTRTATTGVRSGRVVGARHKVAFLFTGQGSHYPNMGRELYATEPVFRRTLQRCEEILRAEIGESILKPLYEQPESVAGLEESPLAQPLLFAFGYALAQMWMSWGIQPAAVMGHSFGECIAACVAGVFSLEDGLKFAARRGRLTHLAACRGEMFAVAAPEARIQPYVERYSRKLSIAAFNGPTNVVLAGAREEMAALTEELRADGFRLKKLQSTTAFHSPLMDSILNEFERMAEQIPFSPPNIPLISNVTGQPFGPASIPDARHWRLHMRLPVRFDAGLRALMNRECEAFLEIGPGTTLLGMAAEASGQKDCLLVTSLRPNRSDWDQVTDSVGALYTRGVPFDWKAFDAGRDREKVELPTYPFERQRFWFEAGKPALQATETVQTDSNAWREWLYEVRWIPQDFPDTCDASGRWLVLADRRGVGEHVARALEAQGHGVELLYEPSSPLELQEAVRRWVEPRGGSIVHLWSLDTADATLDRAQRATCETLLNVLQALIHSDGANSTGIWAVTAGAQALADTDNLNPFQALTWGFGRTAVLEHPENWRGLIDLAADETVAEQAELVVRQIRARQESGEDQTAFRKSRRFVPRLVRAEVQSPALPAFRVRPDATYLIAGGLGKLGLKSAKWLVGLGARHLILLGRRGPKDVPAAAQVIDELRSEGASVEILSADIADERQIESVRDRLRHAPPLAGIIAAAGTYSRAPLTATDFTTMEQLFRAKVAGTVALGELAHEFNPDIFVLFSSTTSLVGTRDAAHYGAACQFQDAFAAQGRKNGRQVRTINWGLWDETGAGGESDRALRLAGNRGMNAKEAFAALEYLLTQDESQKMVASVDWSVLKPLYETRRKKPFLEQLEAAPEVTGPTGHEQAALRNRFFAAPSDDRLGIVRELIVAAVADIVGLPAASIGSDASFAETGMDSLMASSLRNRLQAQAGLILPNTLAFDFPTVEALAGHLRERLETVGPASDTANARIEPARRTVVRTAFPLSPAQETFWFLYKDNVAFNIPLPYRLKGRLDIAGIESALSEIVRRHEALRTRFEIIEGEPHQIVAESGKIPVSIEDLSDLPREHREREIARRVASWSESTFDLRTGPLLKVCLLQSGETDSVLLFVAHHMIFDAWSMKLLIDEFQAFYNAGDSQRTSTLPMPAIQYVDYSEWRKTGANTGDHLKYWQREFEKGLPALPFPEPRTGERSARGEKFRTILPPALVDPLRQYSAEARQTLFALMFSTFGVLVHHYSGLDEVVLMSAGAGRNMHETEALIGMFAAPLLVRSQFSPDLAFSEFLKRVQTSFLGALAHEIPLPALLAGLGMNGMNVGSQEKAPVLSQVFFDSLPNIPLNLELRGLENAAYFPTERERMRHDLEIYIRPVPQGVYCAIWCNRNLFDPSAPRKMMADYSELLGRIAQSPEGRICDLLRGIEPGLVPGKQPSAAGAND